MIVVYTALFGNYDVLPVVKPLTGIRFVAFTDQNGPDNGWECLRPPTTESTNSLENRKYKTRPQALFPSAEWTVYTDANLDLLIDIRDIVKDCEDGLNIFRHPERQCAYAEAEVIRRRVAKTTLERQLQKYRDEEFPENHGLYLGGFLIRNNKADEFNDLWWKEVQSGVGRDQVSLPYAIWKTGVSYRIMEVGIPALPGETNSFCTRRKHIRR